MLGEARAVRQAHELGDLLYRCVGLDRELDVKPLTDPLGGPRQHRAALSEVGDDLDPFIA